MEKNEAESTNQLLRVVIALLLRQKHQGYQSLREQLSVLDDLGVRPAEIARILGRTSTYVNKELVAIRKSKRR